MVSLLPTKTLTIDGDTRLGQPGVPARLWLPVVQGLLHCQFLFLQSVLVHGNRLSQEPAGRFIFRFCIIFSNRNNRSTVSTGTIARQFQQELSLHSFNRSHRSTFPVWSSIDFPCSVHRSKIPVRFPHSEDYSILFIYLVRTEPSDLPYEFEHQLLQSTPATNPFWAS